MSGPLEGQNAIVIGGGSGIGLGSARLLARDGALVTIAGRTEEKLRNAAATLAEEGLNVQWAVCDALQGKSVSDAVEAASDAKRRLHIAVVVPGGASRTGVLMYEDDQFSREVDLNIRPVYLTLKYAGRAMVRASFGSFVAISSTAAAFSTRWIASYAVGKAAVDHLVRIAADELGAMNVRVNSVRPGLTRTPLTEAIFAQPAWVEAFLDQQPLRRGGEVVDVAAAVRFLAGPESSWITGQHVGVDGGNTLRAYPDYASFMDNMPDQRAAALDDAGS